jgi:hypothetical protein
MPGLTFLIKDYQKYTKSPFFSFFWNPILGQILKSILYVFKGGDLLYCVHLGEDIKFQKFYGLFLFWVSIRLECKKFRKFFIRNRFALCWINNIQNCHTQVGMSSKLHWSTTAVSTGCTIQGNPSPPGFDS